MEINTLKNTLHADLAAQQTQKLQRAQKAKEPLQEKPVEQAQKAEFYQEPDQYIPREPEEASGRYWVEQGADGPRVKYDAEDAPQAPKAEDKTSNVTTCSTDEVDREIKQLKNKVEKLDAQAERAKSPEERERLEKQLGQAEAELRRKDNDSYRRSHAKFS